MKLPERPTRLLFFPGKGGVDKIMTTNGRNLAEEGRRPLRENFRSPCTEEVAAFHAFARIVAEARSDVVVLDTAPTGHTLLLMEATGAYHRQMLRDLDPEGGRAHVDAAAAVAGSELDPDSAGDLAGSDADVGSRRPCIPSWRRSHACTTAWRAVTKWSYR